MKKLRLVVIVSLLFPGGALALPVYSNIYAFGDSLSDTGNNSLALGGATSQAPFGVVPVFPYDSGRYSNGPVWVEQLASALGLRVSPSRQGGTNFAHGGATTGPASPDGAAFPPSLIDQVGTFINGLGQSSANPNALYTVVGGGNNVRNLGAAVAAIDDPNEALPIIEAAIADFAADITAIVSGLALAGAVDILVANVPDIGLLPAALLLELDFPGFAVQATALSVGFNDALDLTLTGLELSFPNLNIARLDVFGLLNEIVAGSGDSGLTTADAACLMFGATDDPICANPDEYLFWDGIHPTTAAHAILAQRGLAALTVAVPEPGTTGLLTIALMGLVVLSRRRLGVQRST